MKRIGCLFTGIFFFICTACFAQAKKAVQNHLTNEAKPKLVVGLVIDQMRWDYLYRYNKLYRSGGFKRILKEGYSCENTMIPYTPSYTAPGHTCIYTGSVPAIHGIVGNNWYNRKKDSIMYCTDDDTAHTVGSTTRAGKMSPANLWVSTITDELRLSNNFKSKVIALALKDRGAILPAGHSGNAAYWYDDIAGRWITSTHYMPALPAWVNTFNAQDLPRKYMRTNWETLLPLNKYEESTADNKMYEDVIMGDNSNVFPHRLSAIEAAMYQAFKVTPFAGTYTFDFAKAAVENESLGKNKAQVPDFLAVSISATDYIGHAFGPNSVEMEDTYLRLDKDIEDFLNWLDNKIGKGKYLFFLTADHGAAHVPGFLAEHKMPGGTLDDLTIENNLNSLIEKQFGISHAVAKVINYQVYVHEKVTDQKEAVINFIINEIKKLDEVASVVRLNELAAAVLPDPLKGRLTNGFTPLRSGDVQFIFKPGFFDGRIRGTTHGVWNPYDAHIPLLFFGWHIKPGKLYRETYMTDIAATLAAMLQVQMPNGCVGHVITELIK